MPTALITGITGQDGSYLAELLCAKGYRVVGAVRDMEHAKSTRGDLLAMGVQLVDWDMSDQHLMTKVLTEYRPAEIYNFAAYSSGSGMYTDPVGIGEVNGLAIVRLLEATREADSTIRLCHASSSELFGDAAETPQSERTPFIPRSPYGAAKLYAHSMIRVYRKHFGLSVCSAILFNHESPRRGLGFVTRKITHQVARIKLGLAGELRLGNLDARRDWGYAGDYVRAMWLMLQQPIVDDYVIATGETHSVRDLCEIAFKHAGLDYRVFVREDPGAFRPDESAQLVGNPTKANEELGWSPRVGLREMIGMMVDADVNQLTRQNFENQTGLNHVQKNR